MRESLKQSLMDRAGGWERYAAGSIVLCNACAVPLFKLDRGIEVGSGAGRMASAFKPVSVADLAVLAEREDIDAGVRATVASWTPGQRAEHCRKIWEPRSGEPMLCPVCLKGFVQILSVTAHEVLDRAYTIELVTIPPDGRAPAVRGRQLGAGKDWLHEVH